MKRIKVFFHGGSSMFLDVAEKNLKDTCDLIANGIMKNVYPQPDPLTKKFRLEAFESFEAGPGSQRTSFFWYHLVIGFSVEKHDDYIEASKVHLEIMRTQLDLMKETKKEKDKDNEWRGE